MEKVDIIWRIVELVGLVGVAIGSGWIFNIITIRSHIKQEKADAQKKEHEAKSDQIDNIKKVFMDLYQPVIDDLEHRLEKMGDKVNAVEEENVQLKKEMAVLKEENSRLVKENEELRDALREIRPDVVPSRRSINAQNQARNKNGQFTRVK